MSGHTPEPWRVHKDERGRGYEIVSEGSLGAEPRAAREVCRINNARQGAKRGVPVRYWEHPEAAANADLLAASPRLAGLLARCLPLAEGIFPPSGYDADGLRALAGEIRAALAAAGHEVPR